MAQAQPPAIPFTILDLYEDFVAQRTAAQVFEGTLGIYGYSARKFCLWLEDLGVAPAEVCRRHVRAYIAKLTDSGLHKATVNLQGRNIKAMLRFGNLDGHCPQIHFTLLLPRPPKRKQPVAREEDVEKLLALDPSPRDRAIVLVMFESGIRRAEASKLNWADLDLSPPQIVRIKVRSGKGDKDRVTFAGERSKGALLVYRQTVPNEPRSPVFHHRFGGRLGIRGIDGVLERLCRDAGLALTPHTFRRGFAVAHRRMGVWDLQRLMRHASV